MLSLLSPPGPERVCRTLAVKVPERRPSEALMEVSRVPWEWLGWG